MDHTLDIRAVACRLAESRWNLRREGDRFVDEDLFICLPDDGKVDIGRRRLLSEGRLPRPDCLLSSIRVDGPVTDLLSRMARPSSFIRIRRGRCGVDTASRRSASKSAAPVWEIQGNAIVASPGVSSGISTPFSGGSTRGASMSPPFIRLGSGRPGDLLTITTPCLIRGRFRRSGKGRKAPLVGNFRRAALPMAVSRRLCRLF